MLIAQYNLFYVRDKSKHLYNMWVGQLQSENWQCYHDLKLPKMHELKCAFWKLTLSIMYNLILKCSGPFQ